MKLKVLVYEEEEGGYSASVPALPGCHTQGETMEELLANAREAAECWLEASDALEPDEPPTQVVEIEL